MKICNHKCIMEVFLVYYTLHYCRMHSLDCKRNITLQYNKVSVFPQFNYIFPVGRYSESM